MAHEHKIQVEAVQYSLFIHGSTVSFCSLARFDVFSEVISLFWKTKKIYK